MKKTLFIISVLLFFAACVGRSPKEVEQKIAEEEVHPVTQQDSLSEASE